MHLVSNVETRTHNILVKCPIQILLSRASTMQPLSIQVYKIDMFTNVFLCLPMSSYVYLCLPLFICLPVYLCLPQLTYVSSACMPWSTYVFQGMFHYLLVFVYLGLPMSSYVYLCLPLFICLPVYFVYLCLPQLIYVSSACMPWSTQSNQAFLCTPTYVCTTISYLDHSSLCVSLSPKSSCSCWSCCCCCFASSWTSYLSFPS